MFLKMTNRDVEGVAVVTLEGLIMMGEESGALCGNVKSLIAEGKRKLVLDLKNVTQIDSSGLGALVAIHRSAKLAGASLRLCNLRSQSHELLQITKLYKVFEVSNTEADPVHALAPTSSVG
jgi:anti-sigma B factor antagonist